MSVVRDYYAHQKFNVMELANATALASGGGVVRVKDKPSVPGTHAPAAAGDEAASAGAAATNGAVPEATTPGGAKPPPVPPRGDVGGHDDDDR